MHFVIGPLSFWHAVHPVNSMCWIEISEREIPPLETKENGSSAANESVIISKVGGAANTATTTTVVDLKEVGTASLCESEV